MENLELEKTIKKKKPSIDGFDRRLDTVEERTSWKMEKLVEPI